MVDTRDAYEILQVHPSALPEVVEAAYRALAMVQHPDTNGNRDSGAMAELNWAYSVLHDPEERIAYDRRRRAVLVMPERASLLERMQRTVEAAEARDEPGPAHVVIDFGRYAGMTLGQLARIDPVYLEWLRRHSSGARYRNLLDAVLATVTTRRQTAVAESPE